MPNFPSYPAAELLEFINRRMKMTSYYQPLVIKELILAGGRKSKDSLAASLLLEDRFKIERAQEILMRWPHMTLQKHRIAYYDKSRREFVLPVEASDDEKASIVAACERALAEWRIKEAQPAAIASLCYRVFERANGKCQACGTPAAARPLDVDHIVPRAKVRSDGRVKLDDGSLVPVDDEKNLQALCSRCNRAKRAGSTHDFRPKEAWLIEAIADTLRLASRHGYNPAEVFRLAKKAFDTQC